MSRPWAGIEYLQFESGNVRRYYNPLLMRNRYQFGENPEASLFIDDQEIEVKGLSWLGNTLADWINRCIDYENG